MKQILTNERKAVRLHLTNIAGLGAVQLLRSLLPSLEEASNYRLEKIYLPTRGELADYKPANEEVNLIRYKRYLPNLISRLLECTVFGSKFDGTTPLLVFGDMPLRCNTQQTVFVQTTLLTRGASSGGYFGDIKYRMLRWLFRFNMGRVSAFIVQTGAMKSSLIDTYPEIKDRVYIIAQSVPDWLIESPLQRNRPNKRTELGLRLFYPAATYPHKNHQLLSLIKKRHATAWPVSELLLTIPENVNPNPRISWIQCVDRLESNAVIRAYETTDALLFLSISESFGFPLVEAMWIGLPIICPNLPYARALCGNNAIYFNPDNVDSLQKAIVELKKRIDSGWWPDWSENLKIIPRNWEEVAAMMLRIAAGDGSIAH